MSESKELTCKKVLRNTSSSKMFQNRRDFLKNTVFYGTGMLASLASASLLDQFMFNEDLLKQNPDISYQKTIIEQNLVFIGKIILSEVVPMIGNANSSEEEVFDRIEDDPIKLYALGGVAAPFVEEAAYRLAPAILFGNNWTVGITVSLIFAALHNLNDNDYTVSFKKIPLNQFLGGVFYWYLLKEKGVDHSLLAHLANNNTALVASHLRYLFP